MTDDHFLTESLEKFTVDLEDAGFTRVIASDMRRWRGPIHPAFVGLTDATTMDVVISPGWPFQPPALLVSGLKTNHYHALSGLVCMWQDGDPSRDWETVRGFFARIEEWCENALHDWPDDDLAHDAYLNFAPKLRAIATFDYQVLGIHERSWGDFHAEVSGYPPVVSIIPGRQRAAHQLRGLWMHAGTLTVPPPRSLAEITTCISRNQRKALRKELDKRRHEQELAPSGGADLILFCWQRRGITNLLALACQGTGDQLNATALQPAPNDTDSLILRAGPDALDLQNCNATLFGAGAIGGYVAMGVATSGLGQLTIVDNDTLLPGNVVRHVAGHNQVGKPKVQAVHDAVMNHAPWIRVTQFQEAPYAPSQIRQRISGADIVIDATGNDAFTYSLATVAEEIGVPMVSGALYRGGRIARVRRQALPDDTSIQRREDLSRYPMIPAGDATDDFAQPALGCSAPVNNAPPASVLLCASLIVQATADVLTRRFEFGDEEIEVIRAIAEPPFDHVGRIACQTRYQANHTEGSPDLPVCNNDTS